MGAGVGAVEEVGAGAGRLMRAGDKEGAGGVMGAGVGSGARRVVGAGVGAGAGVDAVDFVVPGLGTICGVTNAGSMQRKIERARYPFILH